METYHFLFKYIIIGDTSVGKSCLLLHYTEKSFVEEHDTTIGVEFGSQLVKIGDKSVKIQIWDTAGQESFRSVTRSYYKGSIGVILTFDLSRKETFYNLVKWRNEVVDCTHENVEMVLVGNKCDLENDRQVTYEEAKEFAEQNQMEYMETSAKSGQNVDRVFEEMAGRIMKKIENKEVDYSNDIYGIKLGTYYKQIDQYDKPQLKQEEQNKSQCC